MQKQTPLSRIQWLALTLVLALLCLSLLSGCGFKLRGAYQLPPAMQQTYIDAASVNADLVRSLSIALRASDIELLDVPSDDAAQLKLFKETRSKRVVSVDSRGRAREYTLTYAISFSLVGKQPATGEAFHIEQQDLQIDRDFLFDPEDVLGNARGESQLYDEMRQDLVRLILLRLQSKA
ncbi:MAG TPA: LPS assembly lipoprotein LptE [Gammaproteobacteria bacterium]